MNIAIILYSSPSSENALIALKYCQAAVAQGHTIERIFCYQDGVLFANALTVTPQGEFNLRGAFKHFVAEHDIRLFACIASCLRRGILSESEAVRYEKPVANFDKEFELAGLAEFFDACHQADRVLEF